MAPSFSLSDYDEITAMMRDGWDRLTEFGNATPYPGPYALLSWRDSTYKWFITRRFKVTAELFWCVRIEATRVNLYFPDGQVEFEAATMEWQLCYSRIMYLRSILLNSSHA